MQSQNLTRAGFVAAAIAVVALVGVMASYIAPLPLERAIAREAALDELLAAPDSYDRLAVRLDDSAAAVKPGADLAARVAAERVAMRARLSAAAAEAGTRLRLMVLVSAVMAGLFAAAMFGMGRPVR
jgi:hypothetical protein